MKGIIYLERIIYLLWELIFHKQVAIAQLPFPKEAVKYSISIVILNKANNLLPAAWLCFIYRFFLCQNDNSVRLSCNADLQRENILLKSPFKSRKRLRDDSLN